MILTLSIHGKVHRFEGDTLAVLRSADELVARARLKEKG